MSFEVIDTKFNEAKIIESFFSKDGRGSFQKLFEHNVFNNNGIAFDIKEVFISVSRKNVIRGLHFQYNRPQSKIVTIVKGACFDVIVDLRKRSNTYLQYEAFLLNDDNHDLLYIPKGFAHGFLSLEDDTQMMYLCDNVYDSKSDTGIIYNDKRLDIDWHCDDLENAIVSDRDKNLMTVDEFEKMNLFI